MTWQELSVSIGVVVVLLGLFVGYLIGKTEK